jgi:hypothetical protein
MSAPSVTEFRVTFPEFTSDLYQDAQVTMWLGFAQSMVNECRWGSLYNLGCYLVTAHNLVLSARDQAAVDAGGVAGEMTGPVASKSVDKVAVSYSTGDAAIKDGAAWNLSTYGVRYKTMARIFSTGGLVV